MIKKLDIGVVGTGHLGKLHTKMFKEIENCNLVGINDSNIEQAKVVGKEFDVNVFESINDLLNQVDAVSIAATTIAHYDLAKMCLNAGKHIFIEKPITATIPQAEEIVELADSLNLNVQVGHIERFNPALVSMEKYINDPKFIQTDRLAQFNPRGTDVAVVLDLMIHDIDIILSLIKSKVESIEASGVARSFLLIPVSIRSCSSRQPRREPRRVMIIRSPNLILRFPLLEVTRPCVKRSRPTV